VNLSIFIKTVMEILFQRGAFVSEPAILVKRSGVLGNQVWCMDKLENKLIDMRDLYEETCRNGLDHVSVILITDGRGDLWR